MVDISVLMAVHNESTELIACAIQSIMNQSMQTFELILCDDASNLVVSQYLKKVQMSDDRIHLLRSDENLYAGKTRNMGLKVAKGRYIAILDADDYSYPDRLKIQYEFLESHSQYAFVCSDADIYDGKNTLPSQYKLKSDPEKEDFLWGMPFVHATVMIRKACMNQVGGYAETKVSRRSEDYDLFMRLYALGYKGYNLNQILYRYYVNPELMKKKRLYRYRVDEARIRMKNFKLLGLWPKGFLYAIKPLLVGLIPHELMWRLKNKQ